MLPPDIRDATGGKQDASHPYCISYRKVWHRFGGPWWDIYRCWDSCALWALGAYGGWRLAAVFARGRKTPQQQVWWGQSCTGCPWSSTTHTGERNSSAVGRNPRRREVFHISIREVITSVIMCTVSRLTPFCRCFSTCHPYSIFNTVGILSTGVLIIIGTKQTVERVGNIPEDLL